MKRLRFLFVLLILFGISQAAWAGAKEEVAQAAQEWRQAFLAGNAEALGALYAEDAQAIPALTPFRLDGRAAIQALWAGFFQAFPTRGVVLRQVSIQTYGDVVGVETGYYQTMAVDRAGKVTNFLGRYSVTRVKQGGRWLIVEGHLSSLPPSQ
jgi:uncharacterized protein (TIGR02246 family)